MQPHQPDHLYGLHDPGGEQLMRAAGSSSPRPLNNAMHAGRGRRGDVNAQSEFEAIAQFNRGTAKRAFITDQV